MRYWGLRFGVRALRLKVQVLGFGAWDVLYQGTSTGGPLVD